MDESEIQRKRRDNEEMATRRRASLLGYSYLDTRQFETTIPLVPDLLEVEEIKNATEEEIWEGDERGEDYDIEKLEKCIVYMKEKYNLEIYLEPGEAIALNAGYLKTTVLDLVENGGIKILMNL